jgi:hypothetical protein
MSLRTAPDASLLRRGPSLSSVAYRIRSVTDCTQDFVTARQFLELFQRELGIKPPKVEPIFDAGSPESQNAIRSLTARHHQHKPSAWIDTYYPIMNTGVKQQLQVLGKDGKLVWEANLQELADMSDPGRPRDFSVWK